MQGRPSPATVISVIALFVALSGTAVAINKIGSEDIARQAVSAPKLAKGSVKASKLRNGAVRPRHLAQTAPTSLSRDVLAHTEVAEPVETSSSTAIASFVDLETPEAVRVTIAAAQWEVVPLPGNGSDTGEGEIYVSQPSPKPFAVQKVRNDGGVATGIPLYATTVIDGLTPGPNTIQLELTNNGAERTRLEAAEGAGSGWPPNIHGWIETEPTP